MDPDPPQRRTPASGVFVDLGRPTIVFLTVCTQDRVPWLADGEIHAALCAVWSEADAWLVGRYVLMPDHLHLFCAPRDLDIPLNRWVSYWKREFSIKHGRAGQQWQSRHWDTRLRRGENYQAKWEYVRMNPVRKGLVEDPAQWPFQGELNGLQWG